MGANYIQWVLATLHSWVLTWVKFCVWGGDIIMNIFIQSDFFKQPVHCVQRSDATHKDAVVYWNE